MTLSAVSLPYYKTIMKYGLEKFRRFAICVWDVDPCGKTDEKIAQEGLDAMERWMKELNLVLNAEQLGVTFDMLEAIADSTLIMDGGYKVLGRDDVIKILKESMRYGR